MKHFVWRLSIFVSCMVAQPSLARTPDDYLLVHQAEGGHFALAYKSTEWGREAVSFLGLQAGWNVHELLTFGFEISTLAQPLVPQSEDVQDISVVLYGAQLEAHLYSYEFLSLRSTLTAGAGSMGYRFIEPAAAAQNQAEYREESLTYFQGDLTLVGHINPITDVGVGYGRLAVKGLNASGYDSRQTSGGVVTAFLRKRW